MVQQVRLVEVPLGPPGATGPSGLPGPGGLVFFMAGDLVTATGTLGVPVIDGGSALRALARVGRPSQGAPVVVHVDHNGTTVITLTIPANQHESALVTAASPIAVGDALTVDVTAVGSADPGADLVVALSIPN